MGSTYRQFKGAASAACGRFVLHFPTHHSWLSRVILRRLRYRRTRKELEEAIDEFLEDIGENKPE